MKLLTTGIAFLFLFLPAFGDDRIWTCHEGRTASAEFKELNEGNVVLRKNGRALLVPLQELSEADQAYVRQRVEQEKLFLQAPLQIFEHENYKGNKAHIEPRRTYCGTEIPQLLDQSISSLILRKGYQVTLATTADGIGLSKMLIAAQRDIHIPNLSETFNDTIRFIRVIPWHSVIKKGHGGGKDLLALNEGWYYTWTDNETKESSEGVQFVPMAFSHGTTENPNWIQRQTDRPGIDHILGFNEPDKAEHKKNIYLGVQANAVEAMLPLMATGLRIGGPSCKEEGPRKWYPEFMEAARNKHLRIDFMGVHWYDWQSSPSKNRTDSPEDIFERFQQYLEQVYETYKLPIWITEFNANPYRDTKTQLKFLQLALPYLDSLPYVERYAWFEPFDYDGNDNLSATDVNQSNKINKNGGPGNFRERRGDASTPLTRIGIFWSQHESVPAMGEAVYLGGNNLCEDEKEEQP